jgi:transcriptional regulator with XRE-family HTH domain
MNSKKSKTRADNPDPVDVHVGARLRQRRNLAGWSQEQLGKALGLTFQQIQKYERGINRMGASRLYQMAQILKVPVSYFFEELAAGFKKPLLPGFGESGQDILDDIPDGDGDVMTRRETLDLVRTYYLISDPKQRRKVYELMRTLAESAEEAA